MTLRYLIDCYSNTVQDACLKAGVQYIEVPNGKHYLTKLINSPPGDFAGGIVRSPNGDCGFAYNRKTSESVFFIIREAICDDGERQ